MFQNTGSRPSDGATMPTMNRRLRRIVAAIVMALTAVVALPMATATPAAASMPCEGSSTYSWFSSCTYALPGESKTDEFVFIPGQSLLRFEVFTHTQSNGTTLIRARKTTYEYSTHHNAYVATGFSWKYALEPANSALTYVYNEDGSYSHVENPNGDGGGILTFFRWR